MAQSLADERGILNAGNDVQGRMNAMGAGCTGTATLAAAPAGFHVNLASGRLLLVNTRLSRCARVFAMDGMYAV
jgi:hypothetical protein